MSSACANADTYTYPAATAATDAKSVPEISIVIPCFMEEDYLEDSVAQLTTTLEEMGCSYELIFIDDKSTDSTPNIIKRLVDNHPHRRAVYHEKNIGRGGTVTEGFLLATGRIVGFLDIDLEVHCRFIPSMLEAIGSGADGATAFRKYNVGWRPGAWIRHLLSSGYRRLSKILFEIPFHDTETGFKFFVREKIIDISKRTKDVGWFWDSEIMILSHQAGLKIAEVPCRFERRTGATSTVRIFRDIWAYLVAIRRFRKRQRSEAESQHTQLSSK